MPIDSICAPTTPAQQTKEKRPGEDAGGPPIALADDAAHRRNARKARHAGNQVFADENHGEAEAEEGEGGADAPGKGLRRIAGGITAPNVGG